MWTTITTSPEPSLSPGGTRPIRLGIGIGHTDSIPNLRADVRQPWSTYLDQLKTVGCPGIDSSSPPGPSAVRNRGRPGRWEPTHIWWFPTTPRRPVNLGPDVVIAPEHKVCSKRIPTSARGSAAVRALFFPCASVSCQLQKLHETTSVGTVTTTTTSGGGSAVSSTLSYSTARPQRSPPVYAPTATPAPTKSRFPKSSPRKARPHSRVRATRSVLLCETGGRTRTKSRPVKSGAGASLHVSAGRGLHDGSTGRPRKSWSEGTPGALFGRRRRLGGRLTEVVGVRVISWHT